MNTSVSVLAIDIGASSGRILRIDFESDDLYITEDSRFENGACQVGKCLYWDIINIFSNVRDGIKESIKNNENKNPIKSIGIDTWGNDFVLLDKVDCLIENPYSYRDDRTLNIIDYVNSIIPSYELYKRNGIQQVRMNTLYQLVSLVLHRPYVLENAKSFLFIPDYLIYLLTGKKRNEFTLCTISQLFNHQLNSWDTELMEKLGIPIDIFNEIIYPGEVVGCLSNEVNVSSRSIPVIAVGSHDTASAVAAVPNIGDGGSVHISSGTWSIVGIEVNKPIINETTHKLNFSNEGKVDRGIRLEKNVMGLWIFNELHRQFNEEGKNYSYKEMVELAMQAKPFGPVFDPDIELFYSTGNVIGKIKKYCLETQEYVPKSDGEFIRSVLESLALKYRYVIEKFKMLVPNYLKNINIIGGGANNNLLNQLTADYTSMIVYAGPTEATALGNAVEQLTSLGYLRDRDEGRNIISKSFPPKVFIPKTTNEHEAHFKRFVRLVEMD